MREEKVGWKREFNVLVKEEEVNKEENIDGGFLALVLG